MEFKCNVCGSKLGHKRVDDGYVMHEISLDGKIEEVAEKSNGGSEVYCLANKEHELNEDMVSKVTELIY